MDEIALLEACRPQADPPTADERAQVRSLLDDLLAPDAATVPGGVEVAPVVALDRRRGNGRRRRVAMVAVAAMVAAVVAVGGLVTRGPDQLKAPVAAADQLRAIADIALSASPFPDAPYSITNEQTGTIPGAPTRRTTFTLDGGDTVSPVDCGEPTAPGGGSSVPCNPVDRTDLAAIPIDLTGSDADIRLAAEHWVDDQVGQTNGNGDRASFRIMLVSQLLERPDVDRAARASLLRWLADGPGIEAKAGVANAFGRVGTEFTFAVPFANPLSALPRFLVDPSDGYALGVSYTYQYRAAPDAPPSTETTYASSWDRPVANPPLPAEVVSLGTELAAQRTTIEAGLPDARCLLALHAQNGAVATVAMPPTELGTAQSALPVNEPGDTFGVTVPEGWSFIHCW